MKYLRRPTRQSIRPRLDRVAIGAAYHAFCYLHFGLRNAFGVAYVQGFVRMDMIKMKRGGMSVVPAVNATGRDLKFVQPSADFGSPVICDAIDFFTIAGPFQPFQSPLPSLLRRWRKPYSSAILTFRRAKLGRVALGLKRLSACLANVIRGGDGFPWRHQRMLPEMFYPCKPDIFEASYEPVE
jgi:hypothetical protein